MSRDLTAQWLDQNIAPYRSSARVYSDVLSTLDRFPTLRPRTDVYTYDDGRTQLLLNIHGILPISFRSATYNIPISLWLTHPYPQEPPLVYVVPTADMLVRPSKHVDLSGRCNLEYTDNWKRKPDSCSLTLLLEAMQEHFSREPPLYAKPRSKPQENQPAPSPSPSSGPTSRDTSSPGAALAPTTAADRGHVHPPLPPKPHAPHAPTSVVPTPAALSPSPSTAHPPAARVAASFSSPPSHPQTPQTQAYPSVAQANVPPPVPAHPPLSHAFSASAAGSNPASSNSPSTASTSASPHGRPPVPPHPPTRPQAYASTATGLSSPPPYAAPASAPPPLSTGGTFSQSPASSQPPVPPLPYGLQRATSVAATSLAPASGLQSALTSQTTGQFQVRAASVYSPPLQTQMHNHPGYASVASPSPPTGQPHPQSQQSPPYVSSLPPSLFSPAQAVLNHTHYQQPGLPPAPQTPGTILAQSAGPGVAYAAPRNDITPMRPPPSVPPPDLLDEDDNVPQQPAAWLAAAPPRPPNPQTLQLHNALLTALRTSLAQLAQSSADTAARQRAMQAELLLGPEAIRDEQARLVAVRDVCRGVAARWRDVVREGEQRIAEVKRRGEVSVDEMVCASSIVGNQLVNLVAEDNAIEDTMYHLHRALNSGRIDLERFLRTTRVLAEEQFMKRALVEKILHGLPMGMSMG